MENEDVFVSNDNVDTVHQRAPARERNGKNTLRAARGGIDIGVEAVHDENVPLLDGGSGGDEQPYLQDEYGQWDGFPWYRRPSVNDLIHSLF
jgi:hypothetical protein